MGANNLSLAVRVFRAREAGTYEHLRPRLTTWIYDDDLTHKEVAENLGCTKRHATWIMQVLEIHRSDKRNRFIWRQVDARRKERGELFAREWLIELQLVSSIRAYCSAWDRGW